MNYNWKEKDWPKFRYELSEIEDDLLAYAERSGEISGILKTMPEHTKMEAFIDRMVAEAIKTSEIEGEYVSRPDVIYSIRNRLGLDQKPPQIRDKRALGVGELMVDLRNTFADPLTEESLFSWHEMLMADNRRLTIGAWRFHEEPMQVVSGSVGKETVHFEAPPSSRVPEEMQAFLLWYNDTAPRGVAEIRKAPIRSAITHLYFESIHPFEDGNGRIGRAISEKALSQSAGKPVLISISQTIEQNKKAYYKALEKAQRSNEITDWLKYFVKMLLDSLSQTEIQIDFVLRKTKFLSQYQDNLNERQLLVINKMLNGGPDSFENGISAKKYVAITKVSKATATRDLQDLEEKKAMISVGGGRSTRYQINY
jgi:Fic family protein